MTGRRNVAQTRAAPLKPGQEIPDVAATEYVILLHGLWLRGVSLVALARRLRAAGFAVRTFDYATVFGKPEDAIAALRRILATYPKGSRVHLVGHSLGGLIAVEAIRGLRDAPSGHLVCLGSPLRSSATAKSLGAWAGTRWLAGRSQELLCGGVASWDGSRPLGVIAGRLPIGVGMLFGKLKPPHDGTVAVEETRLDGIADHCVVAAAHTTLVYSDEAARQTIAFLRSGRFESGDS